MGRTTDSPIPFLKPVRNGLVWYIQFSHDISIVCSIVKFSPVESNIAHYSQSVDAHLTKRFSSMHDMNDIFLPGSFLQFSFQNWLPLLMDSFPRQQWSGTNVVYKVIEMMFINFVYLLYVQFYLVKRTISAVCMNAMLSIMNVTWLL